MRSGTPTFSAADSSGIRPKDWKMNATPVRRSRSRPDSLIAVTSWPPTCTRPSVGWSSPPMTLSSVVFPDPDRPEITTRWPRGTISDTPCSAWTAVRPEPNLRDTSRTTTMSPAGRVATAPTAGIGAGSAMVAVLLARFLRLRLRIRPDADVIGLGTQQDPVSHAERMEHLGGQLHPPGPVQHGVLDAADRRVAVLVGD